MIGHIHSLRVNNTLISSSRDLSAPINSTGIRFEAELHDKIFETLIQHTWKSVSLSTFYGVSSGTEGLFTQEIFLEIMQKFLQISFEIN